MSDLIQAVLESDEKIDLRQFVSELRQQDKSYLLRNDILNAFSEYCTNHQKPEHFDQSSHLGKLIYYTQEIIREDGNICLIVRPTIASQEIYRLTEDLIVEPMTVQELLDVRDRLVNRFHPQEGDILELDFQPFYDYTPTIRDPKNIGKGVQYLNRYLSSKLFQDPGQWLESLFQFLSVHSYNNLQLLINGRIKSQQQLSSRVKQALGFLGDRPFEQSYDEFRYDLQAMGFEPGWGNTAGRVRETLEILDELLDSPDHQTLEAFLSRIPMVFRIVLVSPHGWFGQEGVLGRPDTGGQVVYVLDQAKSLEQQMQEDLSLAGLDVLGVEPKVIILSRLIPNSDGTLCNQRLEKVHGTDNAWILRVPLREFNPKVTQNWISRFEFWPYLESYAIDSEKELLAEFQGKPDLIVGNYSDGNLVAFLLARRLKVTQCNIAHALEKSKYLFSNLYWNDLEEKYHFSLQFTADLIAMNAANFIISSTYQEIVGTPDSVGQYESYKCFTMPDLYHVVSGVELFSPKFNVVPPGVNENAYFPYSRTEDRIPSDRARIEEMLFTLEDPSQILGKLDDPNKRPLFSMARLDRIKNLTGLAECFGKNEALQEHCNLILVAGKLRVEESSDNEEKDEIVKLYQIIEKYNLQGKIRWLGVRLSKTDSGEIYRVIADRQGVFVQPALFEAFGLTILEAMISGLPTFATQFGGPLEIIQDKFNGFYINPTHLEEMAEKILEFVSKCDQNPNYWYEISTRAIDRVYSTYTWKIHTTKLLSLARIYGFWNYTSKENREDLLRYIEALFYLIYKPRAQKLLEQQMQR
ncbi:sucrose synthase [Coleofasciculus sp. FACHB-64]|uniref:sucrose synthase n=1 Tax=Cyanophyceae TaxID=3028117 RepID=UPI001689A298|nr:MULTISPECIES: sucrose synthase [unclassified Coleofasciculus]MBD1837359.1 sucrose synthase [Coleofasciculus sp. FACHB-501]MBD1878111.1 sucrose synthase [Coleofasciculus sp. FACHB-T130]MBD1887923.1 sucrose synthase [Coleofasciculus sp. FACHB-SPT9]MBD1893761.1 sucrose synthase [Coleofasciculus sp. FACHB-129]MBD1944508.1 sucrose synthase [Coleofasciculus sp. FACHB-712]